ncbi:glutaredoxin-related protein 5, mitochondrial [Leucoraja erinacea]|uniref:glutaredoxin-related protein 5, mitochondrial n=1 Tax=Leucoraja erinaceus TaxID=7782 RepID=UPI0024584FAE|nr:glutaredoxin-related protein 5, mitochondrial [Leucoraja erinacea]
MYSLLRAALRSAARRPLGPGSGSSSNPQPASCRWLAQGPGPVAAGGGGGHGGPGGPGDEELRRRLDGLVRKHKVVVFIKGTPAQPMCGFSNAVVQILRMHGVQPYGAYNVLEDQEIRQGIKNYSNWPTIPQIYFDGEFVGGCDILLQMHQNGDLVEELKKMGIRSALLDTEKEDAK